MAETGAALFLVGAALIAMWPLTRWITAGRRGVEGYTYATATWATAQIGLRLGLALVGVGSVLLVTGSVF